MCHLFRGGLLVRFGQYVAIERIIVAWQSSAVYDQCHGGQCSGVGGIVFLVRTRVAVSQNVASRPTHGHYCVFGKSRRDTDCGTALGKATTDSAGCDFDGFDGLSEFGHCLVHAQLYSVRTRGGPEFCAAVVESE